MVWYRLARATIDDKTRKRSEISVDSNIAIFSFWVRERRWRKLRWRRIFISPQLPFFVPCSSIYIAESVSIFPRSWFWWFNSFSRLQRSRRRRRRWGKNRSIIIQWEWKGKKEMSLRHGIELILLLLRMFWTAHTGRINYVHFRANSRKVRSFVRSLVGSFSYMFKCISFPTAVCIDPTVFPRTRTSTSLVRPI